MKKVILIIVALVAVATTSFAQFTTFQSWPSTSYSLPSVNYNVPSTVNFNTTTVSGYSRSNGTYVQSHVRTMPNTTNWDNYSTKGNYNPYTGSTGYHAKDYSIDAYNYGTGHTIYSGPRGGQYYYNSKGHKTYVPKRSMW